MVENLHDLREERRVGPKGEGAEMAGGEGAETAEGEGAEMAEFWKRLPQVPQLHLNLIGRASFMSSFVCPFVVRRLSFAI